MIIAEKQRPYPLYPSLSFYVIEYDDYYTFIFIFDELWDEKIINNSIAHKNLWSGLQAKKNYVLLIIEKKKHEILMRWCYCELS